MPNAAFGVIPLCVTEMMSNSRHRVAAAADGSDSLSACRPNGCSVVSRLPALTNRCSSRNKRHVGQSDGPNDELGVLLVAGREVPGNGQQSMP